MRQYRKNEALTSNFNYYLHINYGTVFILHWFRTRARIGS